MDATIFFKLLEHSFDTSGAVSTHTHTSGTVSTLSKKKNKVIFSKMDQRGDQQIHYSEFIAAAMARNLALSESNLRTCYLFLDVWNVCVDGLHVTCTWHVCVCVETVLDMCVRVEIVLQMGV